MAALRHGTRRRHRGHRDEYAYGVKQLCRESLQQQHSRGAAGSGEPLALIAAAAQAAGAVGVV